MRVALDEHGGPGVQQRGGSEAKGHRSAWRDSQLGRPAWFPAPSSLLSISVEKSALSEIRFLLRCRGRRTATRAHAVCGRDCLGAQGEVKSYR